MKHFVALLFVALAAIAPARAALVYDGYPTGPGGLSTPYPAVNPEVYAGLIELNYDGVTLLAMSDDYNARTPVGSLGQATFYTYADVMAGAPVKFSPEQYSFEAWNSHSLLFNLVNEISYPGYVSTTSLTGALSQAMAYDPAGTLDNFAIQNQAMWLLMNPSLSFPEWPYGPGCWGPGGLYDVSYSYCPLEVRTYNWSNDFFVATLATPTGTYMDEFLIPIAGQNFTLASGTVTLGPVVPLPPAAWLLGSGLVGLAGVARKRHGAPRWRCCPGQRVRE